jgi:hypothetical protein
MKPGAMILHVRSVDARHVSLLMFTKFTSRERIPSPVPLLRLYEKVPYATTLLTTYEMNMQKLRIKIHQASRI